MSRLQFSLRALLVILTVGCVGIGWTVERARRRGRAIDALVDAGCDVCYLGDGIGELRDYLKIHRPNLFWADLKGGPVQIGLGDSAYSEDEAVYAAITSHISRIYGIKAVTPPTRGWPPDLRKWKSALSRILPDSALEQLETPDWVVGWNLRRKEIEASQPKPQRSPCSICGKIHGGNARARHRD
jgi:hypothetical protein